MNTDTLRAASAGAIVVALVILGPAWPSKSAELTCDGGRDVRVFETMDACMAAMTVECGGCNVPPEWPSALYYLVLLPGAFVAAVWSASRTLARGVAAVVSIMLAIIWALPLYLRIRFPLPLPTLITEILVFWPQYMAFGVGLTGSQGLILPEQHARLITLGCWAVLALVFGLLTKRLRSVWVVFSLALVWVAGTVYLIRLIVPFFNWTLRVTNEL
jgi:hypothetical protein